MLALLAEHPPLFLTGTVVFGLLLGSFLNVVILRLPARLEHDWKGQCRELLELEAADDAPPPDLVFSRSRCPGCGRPIRARENVPVLSYLALRGRCAGCGAAISLRYPLVELLTASLFLLVGWHFGPTLQCLAALVLTAFLVALAGIDFDHQLLPDNLTLPLLWAGLLLSLLGVFTDPVSSIIGAAAGYLLLWSIYHLFRLLTGKEGMGYGDFKLLAALGAWLGWQMLPLVLVLSSVVGAVVGLALLALRRHRKDQPMPFGPYIAAAGWIALIWGEPIVMGWLRFSGLG
ncbi:MAG: prepilin peptidase [Xanthomonadales bacterium]|nr:prepilin peptidase [Xanthomonadales bacterium]NIN59732.1 prepilin peptidase [Xanthomonadales bacterium]NIN75501.1 prepilin peptidase [Xanthomonadales bacterium]NIO15190.1 prepilin peptidase [Xanthomonadales bacterium]NIP12125.1 prepilin peptidase [Xanthomonadales bacterium]